MRPSCAGAPVGTGSNRETATLKANGKLARGRALASLVLGGIANATGAGAAAWHIARTGARQSARLVKCNLGLIQVPPRLRVLHSGEVPCSPMPAPTRALPSRNIDPGVLTAGGDSVQPCDRGRSHDPWRVYRPRGGAGAGSPDRRPGRGDVPGRADRQGRGLRRPRNRGTGLAP